MSVEADAVVLGAGPAGAAAALNLAPFRRVLVLERGAGEESAAVGESLPAAAGRLLRDMGLRDGFAGDGHLPCRARTTLWGSEVATTADALRDPDGHGWHVHRGRLLALLREAAAGRGAAMLTGAEPAAIRREGGAWHIDVTHRGRLFPLRARLLIDARGRGARPLPGTPARRWVDGRLVCGWAAFETGAAPGPAVTRAEPDGWWYGAPLPGGGRLLAFHTDADLPAAADARSAERLLARAAARGIEGGTIGGAAARSGFCAAHGARLSPGAGDGWLAVGDAGLAFEPIAAQGLFHALYTGLAGAEAAHRALSGDGAALEGFARDLEPVWAAYRRRLAEAYRAEARWPDAPFWSRRTATPPEAAGELAGAA